MASESDTAGLLYGQHPLGPAKAGLCHNAAAGQQGKTEGHSLDTLTREARVLSEVSLCPSVSSLGMPKPHSCGARHRAVTDLPHTLPVPTSECHVRVWVLTSRRGMMRWQASSSLLAKQM